MLKHPVMTALVTAAALLAMSGILSPAMALEEFFSAKLRAGNETPFTLSTPGSGVLGLQLDPSETSLTFLLVYSDLVGGTVIGAHIHLGQPGITGGIVIHFCGTGGKPACPASPGQVAGTVTAADVVAVPTQGIAAGDFAAVIRAMRKGDTYTNVHTTTFAGGEVRGPIQ
jgi:hypothetical protein